MSLPPIIIRTLEEIERLPLGLHRDWLPEDIAQADGAELLQFPDSYSGLEGTHAVQGHNDQWGTCFETAMCNRVEEELAYIGDFSAIPDDTATAAYSAITNFNLNDPATDQGTDPDKGFAWWQNNPIAGFKLIGRQKICPTSEFEQRYGISNRRGLLYTISLSQENKAQVLANQPLTPAGQHGTWGDHEIFIKSYAGGTYYGISWGGLIQLDRSFIAGGRVLAADAVTLIRA